MAGIQPFQIDIPKEEVDRLNRKLKDTRFPGGPIVADAGARYGMSRPSILSIVTSPLRNRPTLRMGANPLQHLDKRFRLVFRAKRHQQIPPVHQFDRKPQHLLPARASRASQRDPVVNGTWMAGLFLGI